MSETAFTIDHAPLDAEPSPVEQPSIADRVATARSRHSDEFLVAAVLFTATAAVMWMYTFGWVTPVLRYHSICTSIPTEYGPPVRNVSVQSLSFAVSSSLASIGAAFFTRMPKTAVIACLLVLGGAAALTVAQDEPIYFHSVFVDCY